MKMPEGWKLVPVDPTDRMTAMGQWEQVPFHAPVTDCVNANIKAKEIYKAMLAASPTPPAQENQWQEAVLNECMTIEGCYTKADPVGTVKCLIDWHVRNTDNDKLRKAAEELLEILDANWEDVDEVQNLRKAMEGK